MVPLRVANMFGCAFFAGFGLLAHDVKTFLLYFLMLPINAVRLRQMLNLVIQYRDLDVSGVPESTLPTSPVNDYNYNG